MQLVAAGDPEATQELCARLSWLKGIIQSRTDADDVEDQFHDLMLHLIQQLRRGALRNPEALLPYVYGMLRNQIAKHFYLRVRASAQKELDPDLSDSKEDPETAMSRKETAELMRRVLRALPRMQKELLIRFYLLEERREEIEAALGITPTQFRLGKSRAKARFTELFRAAQRRSPAVSS